MANESDKKPGSSNTNTSKNNTSNSEVSAQDAAENARIDAEKKQLDDIITRSEPAAQKKKALDKIRKQVADDIIKDKTHSRRDRRSAAEVKKKAAEARNARLKILGQSYVSDSNDHLERLANSFDTSARRWEMVVYPTLFAFILLAGYGFYLIFRLTHDIAVLSESVTHMAVIVSDSMPKMTRDIRGMTGSVDDMSEEINTMSGQMTTMTPMSQNIANMTSTMQDMNSSVYGMQRDMSGMNRTISGGPFGMMNDVMPFTSNSYTRPPPQLPQRMNVASPMPRALPAKAPEAAVPEVDEEPSGEPAVISTLEIGKE